VKKLGPKKTGAHDVHVGMKLRTIRHNHCMSQDVLGDRLGLTFQQVQKYEKGVNRIGAGRLFQIAGIFGVEVGYFFDGLDQTGRVEPMRTLSRSAVGIAQRFDALPAAEQPKALSVINACLGAHAPKTRAA
jgi:transcriptional regulator with XRE-family HTH domain